ncbi:hypothetical protein A8F94_04045 [Bacillus sp. FJAT-27225]|nr:hypothetical protein A8F94_04045 [Bacillus sp. FJAT-27225]
MGAFLCAHEVIIQGAFPRGAEIKGKQIESRYGYFFTAVFVFINRMKDGMSTFSRLFPSSNRMKDGMTTFLGLFPS